MVFGTRFGNVASSGGVVSLFKAILWTGDGNATQAITGVGFQPEMLIIMSRNVAHSAILMDSTRGVGVYQNIDTGDAEVTDASILDNFDADGFTVKTSSFVNTSGSNYVAWCFKKAPNFFNIVQYTGSGVNRTLPHGLTTTPAFLWAKGRNLSTPMHAYHENMDASPEQKILTLATNFVPITSSIVWNDTAPTSSLFSLGTESGVNGNTQSCISYHFAETAGITSFGSYVGNGSTTGPIVTTGFQVAGLIIKRISSAGSWHVIDDQRADNALFLDIQGPESAGISITLNPTDFQLATTDAGVNANGETYIYMAFA